MKHTTQRSNPIDRLNGRTAGLTPPDVSTWVEMAPPTSVASTHQRSRSVRGGLVVAAGLGGMVVAIGSAFATPADLQPLSQITVGGLGLALVAFGMQQRRRASRRTDGAGRGIELVSLDVDMPSLTGQIGTLLAELRQRHGLAFRSRTWIEHVLPSYGAVFLRPALARDLLAVAALDAGGIRADVTALAQAHDRDELVTTAWALRDALRRVLTACDGMQTELSPPSRSDPSCWPASMC